MRTRNACEKRVSKYASWMMVVPLPKSGITLNSKNFVRRPVNVGRILRMVNVFVIGSGSSTEKRPSVCATNPNVSRVLPSGVWTKNPLSNPDAGGGGVGVAGAAAGGVGACAKTGAATVTSAAINANERNMRSLLESKQKQEGDGLTNSSVHCRVR